jgi:hypothetical protein
MTLTNSQVLGARIALIDEAPVETAINAKTNKEANPAEPIKSPTILLNKPKTHHPLNKTYILSFFQFLILDSHEETLKIRITQPVL